MARGDGGKRIFIGREDDESFPHWLERVCASHGWRVHAWVLMGNHFHLLLETPEPNLSAGLGEAGFKDKLLGLIDKAGAKVMKRGAASQEPPSAPVAKARRSGSSGWLGLSWACLKARRACALCERATRGK